MAIKQIDGDREGRKTGRQEGDRGKKRKDMEKNLRVKIGARMIMGRGLIFNPNYLKLS